MGDKRQEMEKAFRAIQQLQADAKKEKLIYAASEAKLKAHFQRIERLNSVIQDLLVEFEKNYPPHEQVED